MCIRDRAYWYLFDDKATFNELFKEEVGRGWMKLSPDTDPEAFKAFLAAHPDIIAKPLEGSSGVGIARYTQDDWQGREEDFLKELLDGQIGIIEERVIPVSYTHLSIAYDFRPRLRSRLTLGG